MSVPAFSNVAVGIEGTTPALPVRTFSDPLTIRIEVAAAAHAVRTNPRFAIGAEATSAASVIGAPSVSVAVRAEVAATATAVDTFPVASAVRIETALGGAICFALSEGTLGAGFAI